MSSTIAQEGLEKFGAFLFEGSLTWHLGLFKNNYTPVEGSTLTDFTDADFSGYSEVTLGAPTLTWNGTNHAAQATFPTATFTRSSTGSPQTIYGWRLRVYDPDEDASYLVDAKLFGPAFVFQNSGDQIQITRILDLRPFGI